MVELNDVPHINFTIEDYIQEVEEAIKNTSFKDMAVPGTGLPNRITQDRVYDIFEGPVVLELVHLTDAGVSPTALEKVRQNRERQALQDRITHFGTSEGPGLAEGGSGWPLEPYPRKCLKLFLSDGFMELQAIELERLPFELGVTPMGTKVGHTFLNILRRSRIYSQRGFLDPPGKYTHHCRCGLSKERECLGDWWPRLRAAEGTPPEVI